MLGNKKTLETNNQGVVPNFPVSIKINKDEVTQTFIEYIAVQHETYFHNSPDTLIGNTVPSIVYENSRFDAEHVDGILSYLIGARAHLFNSVGIFPVFNEDAFFRVAQDFVANKLLKDPRFKHLVKDTSVLVERSLIQAFPKLLRERDLEEAKRSAQDIELNQEAARILKENGITTDIFLLCYLAGIAGSKKSLLGNKTNADVAFENCTQLIIPFRKDGGHFTVAVVHCTQEGNQRCAHIKYYDSLGAGLEHQYKSQLSKFFIKMGFQKVLYSCLSQREQKEKYNCGIFAAFKAIDFANAHAGNDERLLINLDVDYRELFAYFRCRVVEMLSESGCNISLSQEFITKLKEQQSAREIREAQQALESTKNENEIDQEAQESMFSWLGSAISTYYNASTAYFSLKRKRDVAESDKIEDKQSKKESKKESDPFLGANDNRILNLHRKTFIANRYWSTPSVVIEKQNALSFSEDSIDNSAHEDGSISHLSKKQKREIQ